MSLQKIYSKEIAKELGKIAVYLPGEDIKVGDVVRFDFGKPLIGKPKPLGAFKKISSMDFLNVEIDIEKSGEDVDSYQFTSKNVSKTNIGFDVNADLGLNNMPSGKTKIELSFSNEGAIVFIAKECRSERIGNIIALEKTINSKMPDLLWEDTFLVTSVTIASTAFIAQSKTRASKLILGGDVSGISKGPLEMAANGELSIQSSSGDLFIKDWSKDVTVFMDVMRFEKDFFQTRKSNNMENVLGSHKAHIRLKPVNPSEMLEEES